MKIIIAIDTYDLGTIEQIVSETCHNENVLGYKIGAAAAIQWGLPLLRDTIRAQTYTKKIIYDHQKAGNDLSITAEGFMKAISMSGIEEVIIFPFTGYAIAEAWVKAAFKYELTPIFGAFLTEDIYGMDMDDYLPLFDNIYKLGVTNFVIPATVPWFLSTIVYLFDHPDVKDKMTYYCPGIGTQSENYEHLLHLSKNNAIIPIVGRYVVNHSQGIQAGVKEFLNTFKETA